MKKCEISSHTLPFKGKVVQHDKISQRPNIHKIAIKKLHIMTHTL